MELISSIDSGTCSSNFDYDSVRFTCFGDFLVQGFKLSLCQPREVYRVMAEWRSSLIGQVCYKGKICSNYVLYRAFRNLWKVQQDLHIDPCGRNRFIFNFRYQFDFQRVLNRGPWSLYGFLVVIKPWNPFEGVLDVVLRREPFWVKLINVPTTHLNEASLWNIASAAGTVLFIDPVSVEGVRKRVLIDAFAQLRRGAFTPYIGGVRSWVSFVYVNLPFQFCALCYRLGHVMTECPTIEQFDWVEDYMPNMGGHEHLAEPMDIGNLNLNEHHINPYDDDSDESDESTESSMATLDIILNSPVSTLISPASSIGFEFLEGDPCRILLDRIIPTTETFVLPQDEYDRYKNGKRVRPSEGCSSSCIPALPESCLEPVVAPTGQSNIVAQVGECSATVLLISGSSVSTKGSNIQVLDVELSINHDLLNWIHKLSNNEDDAFVTKENVDSPPSQGTARELGEYHAE